MYHSHLLVCWCRYISDIHVFIFVFFYGPSPHVSVCVPLPYAGVPWGEPVTLDVALRMMFTRMDPFRFKPRFLARLASHAFVGTYHSEEKHPISRAIARVYDPACRWVLRRPRTTILIALAIVAVSIPAYFRLGSEFMPPLDEGSILYMPTTLPGISVAEAQTLLNHLQQSAG